MSAQPALAEIELPAPAATVEHLLEHAKAAGAPPRAAAAPKKSWLRKALFAGAAVAALATASWYGWDYVTVGQYLVSTDDAYVKADNTSIAPKVSGYLREVLVRDNENVKAGQVLARIDDRDYRVALEQARADVAAAEAALAGKTAQLDVQQAVIAAASATLDVDKAALTFAAQENRRYTDLAKTGYGSVQNAEQAQSRIAGAEATLQRDSAGLASAQKQLDLLKAEIAQARATLARAHAVQSQAELNLGYTTIIAPIDGTVGNRSLRTGQFVQAGTQLMSVVPLDGAYVVANFKETQLTDVHEGQAVDIAVDMFPGQVVHGHVDSIAPASGQEFALLPPDNATGNFTKVVQRIPVKITFAGDDRGAIVLRPGMSVIPTIKTRDTAKSAVASNLAHQTSDGSCHVKPNPFSLRQRVSRLWQI